MNLRLLPILACGLLAHTVLCGCAVKPQPEPEPQLEKEKTIPGMPQAEQDKVIAEIKELGGKVEFDKDSPDRPVIKVQLSGTNVTDAGLEQLKGLAQK